MKVAIWDTYVKRKDVDKEMHFDIIVPASMDDLQGIIEYGIEYINSKPYETWGLSSTECTYCHIEENNKESVKKAIMDKGYAIEELQNCD